MSEPRAKIDPELTRQLNAASPRGAAAAAPDPVQAVVYLRPAGGELAVPADRIQGIVDALLSRVAETVGGASPRHNTFRNLGSFAVAAGPAFIRELIRQPEVAAAMANKKG